MYEGMEVFEQMNMYLTVGIYLMVGVAIILCVLVIFAIFFNFGLDTGEGTQIGWVAEVIESGVFWRPPLIKIISNEPTFSQSDTILYYGVASKNLANRAREYMKTKEKIIIDYEVRQLVNNWEYASRIVITDIRRV